MTKLLLYCTKSKPYLYKDYLENEYFIDNCGDGRWGIPLNGKIVAECDCEKIEDFSKWEYEYYQLIIHLDLYAGTNGDYPFISNYLKGEKKGYALHLSNVKAFDKPKNLNDFKVFVKCLYEKGRYEQRMLNNAPQNMCHCYDKDENEYILISIRPEWLCKILNGEKTIEIRKKILNSLKELINNE